MAAAPGDMFSIAALVTDQYGRAMIYSEDSFTVDTQNSVIAHSAPADSECSGQHQTNGACPDFDYFAVF